MCFIELQTFETRRFLWLLSLRSFSAHGTLVSRFVPPKIFVRAVSKAPFLISINQIYDLCKLTVLIYPFIILLCATGATGEATGATISGCATRCVCWLVYIIIEFNCWVEDPWRLSIQGSWFWITDTSSVRKKLSSRNMEWINELDFN